MQSNDPPIISGADEVARLVLAEAEQAAAQGTFAVGACLVENKTGRVLQAVRNSVLRRLSGTDETFPFDPTAHAERRLLAWYFQNREPLRLREPAALTVVTSLDPCLMCAGALLGTGFNVAVVATDPTAGVNHDESFAFACLPARFRDLARSRFGYYAVASGGGVAERPVRPYVGGGQVAFRDSEVGFERFARCTATFHESVERVRAQASCSGRPPMELEDPAALAHDSSVKRAFRARWPDAFRHQVTSGGMPHSGLRELLAQVKQQAPSATNAIAFLDPFGNVVLCCADRFTETPLDSAFMQVTRGYAECRFALMAEGTNRATAESCLTHPKYGRFVCLHAPNPRDARTLMLLGAYGSTLEGPMPSGQGAGLQFLEPPLEGSVAELEELIERLPPFYTRIAGVSVTQAPLHRRELGQVP